MALRFPAPAIAGLCLIASTAQAAPDARARQEVAVLLDAVAGSQCQFHHNGSWYEGAQARAHLQKKYDYLEQKKLVASTEQFIERPASERSISGKRYQIRCPGTPAVDSPAWLKERLAGLRRQGRETGAAPRADD